MPITPKNVFSFSSEDPKYPATNLLAKGEPKSWKCKTAGEASAVVVLELDRPTVITSIDFGNDSSAFVQVDVGNKKGEAAPKDDEYKTILLNSSLMNPSESRSLTEGVNRVRCFPKNALVPEVASEKWSLIRFNCTQPFNKNIQYGLKFVKVNGIQDSQEDCKQLGRFRLREDSPDSDKDSSTKSTLFSRWKESRGDTSFSSNQHSSPAAKIRAASNASLSNKKRSPSPEKTIKTIPVTTPPNRNRSKLLYDDDDERPDEKMELKIAKDRSRQEQIDKAKQEEKEKYAKKKVRKDSDDLVIPDVPKHQIGDKPKASASSSHKSPAPEKHSRDKPSASKKRQSSPPLPARDTRQPTPKKPKIESKPTVYKPFNKLLEGVVLAISGIQNPERGEIRQKAIEMGAKYRPDWDAMCTHLICAFPNTPKYNQVRDEGRGIITSKNWVLKGHSLKKRLPWRRYALDKRDREKDESEDEILDERAKTQSQRMSTDSVEEVVVAKEPPTVLSDSDECDTDDEIEKVLKRQAAKPKSPAPVAQISDGQTTDEDENYNHNGRKSAQPLTFAKKVFYLDESLTSVDLIRATDVVKTRKGVVTDELDGQVDFLLCIAKPENMPEDFQGECLRPLWVFESDEMDAFIPLDRYRV